MKKLTQKSLKGEKGDGGKSSERKDEGKNVGGVEKWVEAAAAAAGEAAAGMMKGEEGGTLVLHHSALTDTYQADLSLFNPRKQPLHFEVNNNVRHKLLTKPCLGCMGAKEAAVVSVSLRPQWLDSCSPHLASVGCIQVHLNLAGQTEPVHTQNIEVCLSEQALNTIKASKRFFKTDFLKDVKLLSKLSHTLRKLAIFNYPKLLCCGLVVLALLYSDLCFD